MRQQLMRLEGAAAVGRADEEELASLLRRAGIAVPSERLAAIVVEHVALRAQIARVNDAVLDPAEEPALVFEPRSPSHLREADLT